VGVDIVQEELLRLIDKMVFAEGFSLVLSAALTGFCINKLRKFFVFCESWNLF
jgi:hypothetical protein